MFSQTDQDLHHAAFLARNAKINRDGWMTRAWHLPQPVRAQGEPSFVERTRRSFGDALIGVGERLARTGVARPSATAPEGYGPAV